MVAHEQSSGIGSPTLQDVSLLYSQSGDRRGDKDPGSGFITVLFMANHHVWNLSAHILQ